jgi:hypothetical protein
MKYKLKPAILLLSLTSFSHLQAAYEPPEVASKERRPTFFRLRPLPTISEADFTVALHDLFKRYTHYDSLKDAFISLLLTADTQLSLKFINKSIEDLPTGNC